MTRRPVAQSLFPDIVADKPVGPLPLSVQTRRRALTALVAVGLMVVTVAGLAAAAALRHKPAAEPEPVTVLGHGCVRCHWWRTPVTEVITKGDETSTMTLWYLDHGAPADRPNGAHPVTGPYQVGDQDHEGGGGSRQLVPMWLIVVLCAWVLFRLVAPVVSGEKGRHG